MGNNAQLPLFRHQALEHYIQSREKTILPRLARPPVFLLLWILLGLVALAITVAWFGRVPIYISGTGIVMEHTIIQNRQSVNTPIALVFVPAAPGHSLPLHAGAPVLLRIGMQGQWLTTRVDEVESALLSPDEIQKRYAPGSRILSMVTSPSLAVSIQLGPAFAYRGYAGSLVDAQVQVGSTSVLSSLFGSAQLSGE